LRLCGSELSRDREREKKKILAPNLDPCPAKEKSYFGSMNPPLETGTKKEKRFDYNKKNFPDLNGSRPPQHIMVDKKGLFPEA
jgi:hypothetical protein